jgi:[1-hydroxy-2-(trimethylamino)ethyl]phosphonate dioxygenase
MYRLTAERGTREMNKVNEILQVLEERGQGSYFGEPVSQLEHALQCAYLASRAGAEKDLVVAALLHDVGHLLHEAGEDIADRGGNTEHEHLGEAWLSAQFGPEVTYPIALHVAAKRYLCATDPLYLSKLSPASVQSLELQGGAMSALEVADFEANEFADDAVRLRRWDDLAKDKGLEVPGLDHYREVLASVMRPAAGVRLEHNPDFS